MRRPPTIRPGTSDQRALQVLEKLVRAIVRKQDLRSVIQKLAEELVADFGFKAVLISEFNPAWKGLRVFGIAPRKKLSPLAAKLVSLRLDRPVPSRGSRRNAVVRRLIAGKEWIGRDLAELLAPATPASSVRLLQKKLNLGCFYNAPLFDEKELVGTVLIATDKTEFTLAERSFLRTFTNQTALAFSQARVIADSRSTARQYRLLTEVDSRILEQRQIQQVLKAIVRDIGRVIPCDLAGIYLNSPARKAMVHSVAWPNTEYSRKLSDLEFPYGTGIIGSIAKTRRAEIVNNAHLDRRSVYPPSMKPAVQHLLCLPLIASHRLLGILHVSRLHDEPFQPSDLEIARRFAEKSALAVDNAQLFALQQEREKDLVGLQRSGARIAESLDLETVLNRILTEALNIVPSADNGSIALLETESGDLVVASQIGTRGGPQDPLRLKEGSGVAGNVLRTRTSMVVDDVSKHPLWIVEAPVAKVPVQSVVSVPLILKSEVVGVLNLDSTVRTGAFSDIDVSRLELFALHAALAVRNAQLHASLNQEIKKIKLLRDIKNLARGSMPTAGFLEAVCRLMVEAYDYTLTTILLHDPVRQCLRLAAASGSEAPRVPKEYEQSVRDGIVGWVARMKELRLVQDVGKDSFFINRNNLSTQAELCVPILDAKKNLLGVINTESNKRHAFGETDVQTQSAVAAEIAGTFEEHRLLTALSDSERKFRRLFEESKDAIYVSTPEGVVLDVNQAAVELFGYSSREELEAVNVRETLYQAPEDRDALVGELERNGFLREAELNLKRKNGDQLTVLATITSMRDGQGKTVAYQGILHDITKQKEGEQRLHESEEKYRSLVEDALVGVYIIQDDRFAFINAKFGEIFGYEVDEVIGLLPVGDLVHPDDRAIVRDNIQKRLRGEVRSLRYEFRGLQKSGRVIEVEVFGTRSTYQDRPAVIGTVLDRTQERSQQREIDEWKRRYELIIASSGQIVYEFNIHSGEVLWGGSIEPVLGYGVAEMRGTIKEWEELVHPEDRDQVLRELDAAMKAMFPYLGEYRFRRKDGSFVWMRDRGFFVPDENGRARLMLGMMEDITQARELEERVAFSELKHRLLFEHANDGVLLMNGDVITDCNPRGLELFGCTRDDLVGQTLYAFSPPHQVDGSESKAALQEYIRKGLEGDPQRFTWRHMRRDGSLFEAAVRLTRFELAGEALLQVQVRDRTAEAEAREELARSEETYRRLVLEASDPILVADGEGQLVEVNQAASELFGYSREELLKRSVSDLSDIPREEALAWYRQFYARLISEDHGTMADQFMRRKDGTRFPFEMSAALLGNGLLQAFIHDVSEKKQAEEELDRIYRLATTFHGMELLDKAAGALAEMLSMRYVSIGEIRDRTVNSLTFYKQGKLFHDTTHLLQGSPCERVLADRMPCFIGSGASSAFPHDPLLQEWKIESVIGVPMLDNRRDVMGIVALLDDRPHEFSDHEKKIVSIIAQRLASELDMLGQRKREEQLSQQLAQSQKMESLGTLAGGVAHDFNNILGAVIGYITLIKKRAHADEQVERYLDAIEKSAQRAASLSKQLLSFSHKTQGEIRPVEVNDLVKDTIHIIASSFPKNIGLHTQLDGELPPVLGDSNLLGQVVMNLCINARDAVSERTDRSGGSITVTTSLFKAGAGFVDLHLAEVPGNYVCLCVKDDGVGMNPEVKARIFEPFYTTKGKGRGTGLGLSMVYGIVRNHNGGIDVRSEPGRGSEFRIFLPAAPADKPEEAAVAPELPHGNGEVIMIVEDEPMLRELVSDVLSGQGYMVIGAANGREAVDLFKSQGDKVRLVILDMIMPEMDGEETFGALRKLRPDIRVLISSGFSQDGGVQRLLSDGASGFVGKPYQAEELLEAVTRHLRN